MRSKPRLPDFIGIGAQKAGTTWLYQNLRTHPDVWLPAEKELHYFDEKLGSRQRLWNKLFGDDRVDVRWRAHAARQFRILRRSFNVGNLRWSVTFLQRRPDDDWYASLFRPAEGKVAGEITPNYALLTADRVAHVQRLIPQARIFFFVRHPLERAWSHALMEVLRKKRALTHDEVALLRRHFTTESSRARTDYLHTIDVWSCFFPPEQIFIGFLEDVHFHPHQLLRRVCDFLGIAEPEEWPHLARRVYASSTETMPLAEAAELADLHAQLIESLAHRFGGYAEWWQYSSRRIREGGGAESTIAYPLYEGPLWDEWLERRPQPPVQSGTLTDVGRSKPRAAQLRLS